MTNQITRFMRVYLFFTFLMVQPLRSQEQTVTPPEVPAQAKPAISLQIMRMELAFENGLFQQIVRKGEQQPRIRCRIQAQGQGTLHGLWLINDQIVQPIQFAVAGYQDIQLSGHQLPTLPTQDSGLHSVSLLVKQPSTNQPLPVLRYFVTTEPPLKAISPLSGQSSPLNAEIILHCTTVKGDYRYQMAVSQIPFQFLKDDQIHWNDPVTEPQYTLNTQNMSPGHVYWLVRAVSSTGRIVSASEINYFLLKEKQPQAAEEVNK